MPRVNVLTRTEGDQKRESTLDIVKVRRTTNPLVHPFQKVLFPLLIDIGKRV